MGDQESDLERASFVMHFAFYDLHSKNRTDTIPTVDVTRIKQLLTKYVSAPDGVVGTLEQAIEW